MGREVCVCFKDIFKWFCLVYCGRSGVSRFFYCLNGEGMLILEMNINTVINR